MPGGKGTLLGGEGYMFNPKASPEKIRAGLTWLQWKFLNPDRTELNIKRFLASQPIGLATPPTPDIWTGTERTQTEALKAKYANIPVRNYQILCRRVEGPLTGRLEPPNAQQIYAALDR